jgi:transposase
VLNETIHQSSVWPGFHPGCVPQPDDLVEVPDIMRALRPDVVDAIWTAIAPLLPPPDRSHPLGCHRPRIPDRLCFRGLLIRLVTGASWVDVEAILEHQVSDTTLRARRDEWVAAGVFEQLKDEALAAFDRIIELDLDDVAIDGSLHKAPCGGEGTGPNPTDRAKLGWKWSVASERHGIPIGWAIDGANRNDVRMLEPTLDAVAAAGLLVDIGTLHLDRGYDYDKTRGQLRARGLTELEIQRRGTKVPGVKKQPLRLGLRWIVEATNTWWSNHGQLRRSTDRRNRHRHAALCLATTVLIVGRLIDWRDRWTPTA